MIRCTRTGQSKATGQAIMVRWLLQLKQGRNCFQDFVLRAANGIGFVLAPLAGTHGPGFPRALRPQATPWRRMVPIQWSQFLGKGRNALWEVARQARAGKSRRWKVVAQWAKRVNGL